MVETLLTRRTKQTSAEANFLASLCVLTARENHPDEVDEEIVEPEVQELGSAVLDALVPIVEQVGSVVKDETVHLTNADDDLDRVA
jgi:hypothetical protein